MKALLLAHAVLGFAAVYSATHHAAHSVVAALGKPQARALRRFGWIAPVAIVAQAAVGLAIYPAYRVGVRAAVLERTAPFVVQLFDFKEHLAALSLALVIGAALAGRKEESRRWPLAALSCTGAAFLWAATLIGLYVTAQKSI
jgi:hypothetical protein